MIALAVAVAVGFRLVGQAQNQSAPAAAADTSAPQPAAPAAVEASAPQPAPTTAADTGAPTDIVPGSPLADVIKMVQAGVQSVAVKGYIVNCQNQFNLEADKIVYLKDLGVSSDLINAMLDRDKVLYAASVTPAPAAAAAPAPEPMPA